MRKVLSEMIIKIGEVELTADGGKVDPEAQSEEGKKLLEKIKEMMSGEEAIVTIGLPAEKVAEAAEEAAGEAGGEEGAEPENAIEAVGEVETEEPAGPPVGGEEEEEEEEEEGGGKPPFAEGKNKTKQTLSEVKCPECKPGKPCPKCAKKKVKVDAACEEVNKIASSVEEDFMERSW